MFLERLKIVFDGWLAVKPKQLIDLWKQPIVCFGTITENCFVLWLSFKWFYNWIRSSFKCFEQALNAINSLFKFCNKQLSFNQIKIDLSFSLILLLKELKIALRLLGSKRVWYRIFILYWFQICSVTSVIFCTFERNSVCIAEKCCVFLRSSRSTFLVVLCWSKGSVCLEGIKVTSLVVL